MPPDGVEPLTHAEVLRNEEFVALIKIFVSLGIKKVRFTGGEPLIRRGFLDMVKQVRVLFPYLEIGITTNGVLLGDVVDDLASAGVKRLNISLDSIDPARFHSITMKDACAAVLANIDRALDAGVFDVKINAVLMKDTLDGIGSFLDYFKERPVTLRFIERMPFTRDDGPFKFIPSYQLEDELARLGTLTRVSELDTPVACMYDFLYRGDFNIRVGIIPSITRRFCGSCNRLRLMADGFLKTCLHGSNDIDLKTPLRQGMASRAMKGLILTAVTGKPEGHSLECTTGAGGCSSLVITRNMSKIGG